MSRSSIWKLATAALIAIAAASAAKADGGGGGGNDRLVEAAAAAAKPGPRVNPNQRPFAETTLPDGTRIRSEDLGVRNHRVTTTTPDGRRVAGNRPDKAFNKPNGNRTVYNSKTGITSTFTNNPDGTRTGVHVDRQGNRSVSTSRPALNP
jgi:hypothetical protein